tara:strand:+ start:48887 stop:49387 length:501 start_codon:yes stop_codon:yes gene_type:complete
MTKETKLESVSLTSIATASAETASADSASIASASIDTPTAELVKLFGGPLAKVQFPGIDASVLTQASERVTSQATEVERLRVALSEARAALEAEQRALRDTARQAHAYARVYAMDNEELTQSLEAIIFDTDKPKAAKKTRARRSKAKTPQLMLDNEAPAQAAGSAG